MSWLDFNGHRIWYQRQGTGRPILFLHHGEADHRLWEFQAGHYQRTHEVVVPDLLGFCNSDKPPIAYTLEVYVDLVDRLLGELDPAPVTVVGTCIGAAAALRYSYDHPDRVHALVLVNTLTRSTVETPPSAWLTRPGSLPVRMLHGAVKVGLYPRRIHDRTIRDAFGDSVLQDWVTYFAGQRWADRRAVLAWLSLAENLDSFTDPLPQRRSNLPPVCSVWGAANKILPLTKGREFNRSLAPDKAHVVNGAGHMLPLERPDQLNTLIDQFLARCAPRTAVQARR